MAKWLTLKHRVWEV